MNETRYASWMMTVALVLAIAYAAIVLLDRHPTRTAATGTDAAATGWLASPLSPDARLAA